IDVSKWPGPPRPFAFLSLPHLRGRDKCKPQRTLRVSPAHDAAAQAALRADGSPLRGHGPGGRELAIRAEMGWLSLPPVPRRETDRAAIEIRAIADALFPRAGRSGPRAEDEALRARRRNRRPGRPRLLVRQTPATHSSRSQPREEAGRGDTGAADRV